MINFTLSQDTIIEIEAAHKASSHQRATYVVYKIHLIILLGLGYLPSEVSDNVIR